MPGLQSNMRLGWKSAVLDLSSILFIQSELHCRLFAPLCNSQISLKWQKADNSLKFPESLSTILPQIGGNENGPYILRDLFIILLIDRHWFLFFAVFSEKNSSQYKIWKLNFVVYKLRYKNLQHVETDLILNISFLWIKILNVF